MGEPKPNNSRTWVTVTIAVALISCIGVIVAAVIEGLFDVVIISQTPQPPSTVVLTEPPPSNSSSPSDVGETNTGEKLPTKTVVPSDTDTLSGTILDIGQTWRQGGLELRLDKAEVTIGDEYREHGPGVLIGFSLTNRRSQQITFQITQENFFASDNRGRQLEVGKVNPFYGYYYAPPMDDMPINLQSGEHIELYYDYDAFFVRDDITDPSITEIIIGATGISSINNARWRIPIFH